MFHVTKISHCNEWTNVKLEACGLVHHVGWNGVRVARSIYIDRLARICPHVLEDILAWLEWRDSRGEI